MAHTNIQGWETFFCQGPCICLKHHSEIIQNYQLKNFGRAKPNNLRVWYDKWDGCKALLRQRILQSQRTVEFHKAWLITKAISGAQLGRNQETGTQSKPLPANCGRTCCLTACTLAERWNSLRATLEPRHSDLKCGHPSWQPECWAKSTPPDIVNCRQ